MARTRPWELSEEVWERAEPLLPAPKPRLKGGRPPRSDREMLGAMLHPLRTGLQWNALPREIGASTTVYDRFRAWERDGFFARLWAAGLAEYDELVGIDWEWLSLDGVMTKAPFGGAATGANPTDRGIRGTKRSTLCEGHGLPLAIVVAGANVPDMKLTAPTLDALVVERPEPTADEPQHLCLDAGYDYDLPRFAAEQRHYVAHIQPRGADRANAGSTDPLKRPRRWVVERLHSWLNRSRRVLVRWEKLERTYEAFLHLACALLCFQQCDRCRAHLAASP
jgi:putative transposase